MSFEREKEEYEFLLDQERSRVEERELRVLLEALLDGLRVLSSPSSPDAVVSEMIHLLRDGLKAEQVFVLEGPPDETLSVVASTSPDFGNSTWQAGEFFDRVFKGEVGLAFDVEPIPEWAGIDPAVRTSVTSALHVPLSTHPLRSLLVCTHSSRGFFNRSHARLVEKFAPLAAQAMLTSRARESDARERNLQEARRQAQARLDILDHATGSLGVGVVIWRPGEGFTNTSPEFERMLVGWRDPNAWWEQAVRAMGPPTLVHCPTCEGPAYAGARTVTMEAENGVKRAFQIIFSGHIHGIEGRAEGEVVLVKDVTEGQHLQEDAGDLGEFFRQNPNPVMRAGRDGKLIFANSAASPLLDSCGVMEGGIFREDIREALGVAADTRDIQEVEVECEGRTISLFIRPLPGSSDLNLYGRDVTEARKTADALRFNEERTRMIVESSLDAIVTMNGLGAITGWNPRAEEMFGWTEDEAMGRLMGDMIVPERFREAHARGLERFVTTHHGTVIGQRIEMPALHRNGTEFPVELIIRATKSEDGDGGYSFSGFVRDLTEQKESEAQLARARETELAVGASIQEMFLQGKPPEAHPSFELGVFSRASMGLDGDFIDFLPHGDRRLDVVVGDVMGKGIPAALLGAATKSQFIRSLSQLQSSLGRIPQPQEIVASVHGAVSARLMELESFATALFARFDLDEGVVDYVDCGHPKMIHYQARTGTCSLLEGHDLPLGFSERSSYRQERVHFEAGDMFLLYSDGLTEIFSPEGEILGEERVAEAVSSHGHRPVPEVIHTIWEMAKAFGNSRELRDDCTFAVVRVSDVGPYPMGSLERVLHLRKDSAELAQVRTVVDQVWARFNPGRTGTEGSELKQALQEVLTNVIRHSGDPDPQGQFEVRFKATPKSVQVEVIYVGVPFQPGEAKLPDLASYPEGGFGLYIIQHSVDIAQYGVMNDGRNIVRLIKWFSKEDEPAGSQA